MNITNQIIKLLIILGSGLGVIQAHGFASEGFRRDWQISDIRPYTGASVSYNNVRLNDVKQLTYPNAKNHNVGLGLFLGFQLNACVATEFGYDFVEAIKLAADLKHMRVQVPYWVVNFRTEYFDYFKPYLALGVGRPRLFFPGDAPISRMGFRGGIGIDWPFCDQQVILRGFANYQKMNSGQQGARWNTNFGFGLIIDWVALFCNLDMG